MGPGVEWTESQRLLTAGVATLEQAFGKDTEAFLWGQTKAMIGIISIHWLIYSFISMICLSFTAAIEHLLAGALVTKIRQHHG